ncbi:MAG: 50S ribosomal protein L19 [SAR202 cluster bacterium]|nr:50S ribosomal protein L19 [SAR202 cluster bacterium]
MDAAATLVPAKVRASVQDFNVGDTVRVNVTIREGDRTRVQAFQGIVLKGSYARQKPPAPSATFTVRRVSYGTGVERTFLLCSPLIDSLENTRRGKVAQGRLFYLRGLSGKKARIKEKRLVPGTAAIDESQIATEPVEPEAVVAEAAPAAPPTSAKPAQASDQAKA